MPRDKETQKVRGFAFLMYLDQRSTVLAVDNLNGAKVLNRTLRVDHTKNYRQTKILNEETGEMEDADEERMNALPKMIGGDGEPVSAAPAAIAPGNEEDPMAAYIRDSKVRAQAVEPGLPF
jgi:RNA-binding motif X-linked protein 2